MARTFTVKIRRQSDGSVLATCDGPVCMARARDEAGALALIRDEIRYRLEFCPCSGVDEDYVQLQIVRG
jgi:hypothetical protein